jgi:c-di-GMP-related signal transduction protein
MVGGSDIGSEYFLLGLCSLLDQMMQRPMAAVVSMLPLSQSVRGALLGQPNAAHAVLTCAIAYERGRFDEAAAAADEAHITAAELVAAYFDALQWARALTHDSATA